MLRDLVGKLLTLRYLDNPVFVVGCSRSGTSVLLQALGQHSQIMGSPGEAPFLTSVGGAIGLFEFADNKRYYNDSLNVNKEYLYSSLKRLALEVAAGEHYGLKTLIKSSRAKRSLSIPSRWCAKTFPPKGVADALRVLYPEARFVYIVRNGLEVVQSMTKYKGFSDREFEGHCLAWSKAMRTYEYLQDYPGAAAIRHEQLRSEPDTVFRRVFSVLNLPFERRVVDFVTNTVIHPLDKPTQEATNAGRQFNDRPPPYQSWTDVQRKMFIDACTEEMEKAGYEIPFVA